MTPNTMKEIEHYTILINDAKDQIRKNLELLETYAEKLAAACNKAQGSYR
jgi:hypothetical protein